MAMLALLGVVAQSCESRTSCGECSGFIGGDGSPPCFWCYDTGTCRSVDNPFIAPPLGGCSNFTFFPEDCQCEPGARGGDDRPEIQDRSTTD